jgi:peroxiredoxin Q/BCP
MRRTTALLVALLAIAVIPNVYGEEAKSLSVGDPAPTFEVQDDQGQTWKSSEHFGKKIVVIYFYPADMTGGCTAQACSFRDNMGELADKDVEVVGVSGDTVKNHQLFKKAHGLNFALLADVDGKVADAFGVPKTVGEKTVKAEIDGITHELTRNVTTQRWTFIIDRQGKIAYKDPSVNARQDSQKVLAALAGLR